MSYNGFVMYDIELAFAYTSLSRNISNEVLMDWIELFWFPYFAMIFTLVGKRLKRTSAWIYNLRIFGIYSVWLLFRSNPVYVNTATFDELVRCVLAATLAAIVQRVLKLDNLVHAWTIVTVAAGYAIICFDPLMRERAGCEEEAGPPTEDFPHGVWLGCDDWKFAYTTTWIYLGGTYIAVIFFYCCSKVLQKNKTVGRFSNEIAVSMVSTSAATTATRAFVRRFELDSKDKYDKSVVYFFNIFLDVCFYVFLGITIIVQEIMHRAIKRRSIRDVIEDKSKVPPPQKTGCSKAKGCTKICKPIFFVAAAPFHLVEKILKKLEKWFVKHVEANEDEDEDGDEEADL